MNESAGIGNGTIHVALGCKMDDGARTMLLQRSSHEFCVADIAAHELITRIVLKRGEVGRVSGVGQKIKIYNRRADVFDPLQHEVGADESGAAGYENGVLSANRQKVCPSTPELEVVPNRHSAGRFQTRINGMSYVASLSYLSRWGIDAGLRLYLIRLLANYIPVFGCSQARNMQSP